MKENDTNQNRRRFIKGAAAAGLLGAVGGSPAHGGPAQAAPAVDEPPEPAGLGSAGLLDQRYPVSYQTSIPAAVKVITDYFAALSRRDLQGMAEQCHFPFVTFEGTSVVMVRGIDGLLSNAPASMNTAVAGERWADHGSYMASGCYDIFGGLEVLNSNPVCANLSLVYNRYNSTGHIILQCQGVYVITNNDGKWGIELMSTIFTPGDLIGKAYNETTEAGLRGRIIHDIGPNTNDSDADLFDYQYGKSVTVSVGGGGFFGVRSAHEDPMATFRTKGVKTRLRI
jgi:TAT (twin-arginine translocation) pathway signal sequence